MPSTLLAWIGLTDLRAMRGDPAAGTGPIAQAITARSFDHLILLADGTEKDGKDFARWIARECKTTVHVRPTSLSSPTDFGEIFRAASDACSFARSLGRAITLTFHLSPGTPAMASVWILLAKTRFPAELIESSKEHGVKTARVPFELSLDFVPDLLREQDERLRESSAARAPDAPEFAHIIHRSRAMARVIERARRVAMHNVPVLIEGESGTGKELLARAIHNSSPRRDGAFVAVNCGAIPHELVESELFGHRKGAFTGATDDRKGHFESASGGTLFLDEIGELPLPVQVRLLRVLQEGQVTRLGTSRPIRVDVRVVAATNRVLASEVTAGRFREDLFYRLAVATLALPPLCERQGDVSLLIDKLFDQVSTESAALANQRKALSAGARNVLLGHRWPGNVRELLNTLRRMVIWADGPTITADEVRAALLPVATPRNDDLRGLALGDGFSLPDLMAEVARHYLSRAMKEAQGNKTKAAELVGLPSYQTLSNWLQRYRVP